jgi:hypothetical protein
VAKRKNKLYRTHAIQPVRNENLKHTSGGFIRDSLYKRARENAWGMDFTGKTGMVLLQVTES